MAQKTSLNGKRRTTKLIPITGYNNSDGSLFDFSNCHLVFTVKKKNTDADADAVIRKDIPSIPNPQNGYYLMELTGEVDGDMDVPPGQYIYDFKMRDANGKIIGSETGQFEIFPDVTHEVPA